MKIVKNEDGTINLGDTQVEKVLDEAAQEAKRKKVGYLDLGPAFRLIRRQQKMKEKDK